MSIPADLATPAGDALELQELITLIGPDDPTNPSEPITEQAINDVAEELQDPELWEARQTMVEEDLFKFIDNPSRPSAQDKFKMLDRLGGDSRWYDKWVAEREEMAADYYGENITAGGDVELMDLAKKKVADTFSELERLEEKEEVVQTIAKNGIRNFLTENGDGAPMDFGLSAKDTFKYDFGGDMELTEMRIPDLGVLERPYYALGEDGLQMSQAALAGGEDLEAVGWELLPTLAEASDMLFGVAAGVVGGFAIEGLIDGFVPIVQALQSRGWIHPGGASKSAVARIAYLKGEWQGEYNRLNTVLEKYFEDNPTYLWVFDDGLNSSPPQFVDVVTYDWPKGATQGVPVHKKYKHFYGNSWPAGWNFHPLSGTNLWLRGRILMLQGKKLGYTTDDQNLLVCLKFGDGDVPSGKEAYGTPMFWVNGDLARMLDDSDQSKRACLQSNLSSLYFRDLPNLHPWADPDEPIRPETGAGGWLAGPQGEFVPLSEFNIDSSILDPGGETPDPNQPFFQSTLGGGGDFTVESYTSDQGQNKYPPELQPGRDKIRFYETYFERLRGNPVTMNQWMFVDYVKSLPDDMYLVGGHLTDSRRLPTTLPEGDIPDRYLFQMPYNAILDWRPNDLRWEPFLFSVDRQDWGDKIFADTFVGEMLTDAETGRVARVRGKVIEEPGATKSLLLTLGNGDEVSEKSLQYLRPSTQDETIAWLTEYENSPRKAEEDQILEQWQKDHQKKNPDEKPTKPPPSVPTKVFPGSAISGKDDVERLRIALTEISDLRRRLVALSAQEDIDIAARGEGTPTTKEDERLEDFLQKPKRASPEKDKAVLPLLLVGTVILIAVLNS